MKSGIIFLIHWAIVFVVLVIYGFLAKNVQNKANEKFKAISEAYQRINDLLDKENSSSKKGNYENESASRAKQRRDEEEKQKMGYGLNRNPLL